MASESKKDPTDIDMFCDTLATPGSTINTMATKLGGMTQEKIKSEIKEFKQCIKDTEQGKVSYSEMRARFG